MTPDRVDLHLNPQTATSVLLSMAGSFVILFVVMQGLVAGLQFKDLKFLLALFDLDGERNFPSLFSGLLLIAAALLLAVAARIEKSRGRPHRGWVLLSAVFVYLSFDEWLSFHELLVPVVAKVLKTRGLFLFGWIIPVGLAALVLALLMIPFLRRLPASTRRGFITSGTIYVGGALGMEMLGGLAVDTVGRGTLVYVAETVVEEGLEMLGAILFIRALLDHLQLQYSGISIGMRLSPRTEPERSNTPSGGEKEDVASPLPSP